MIVAPPTRLRLPLGVLPHILRADRFPLLDRAHETRYHHPSFNALHLHLYRGIRRIAGREETLEPGDYTLSPAPAPTTYSLPEPGFHLCVHFAAMPPVPDGPALDLPLHLRPGTAGAHLGDHLHEVLRRHALARRRGPAAVDHAAAASALLLALLHELAALGREGTARPAHPGFERLLAVIDETMAEDLSATELARRAGLSQTVASRLLRRHLGTTMARLRLHRRIEAARHLLAASDLPVAAIGRRVGLPDPQHFNKVFRRFAGCSPGAARERTDQAASASRRRIS